ncbi:MAG: sporulation protein YunB [Clostridia bacterium]|nr:sporulation protein YunB [Clostridia bacterium]
MRLGLCRKFPYFRVLVLFLIVAVLVLIFCFFVTRAEPIFRERASDASAQVVRAAIDEISNDVLKEFSVFKDDDSSFSEVLVVDMNTAQMNEIRTKFSEELSKKLSETHIAKIHITAGSLLGYPALQGLGIQIPVKIYFGAISSVDIKDSFSSAGINQTKYRASLEINVSSSVVSAFMSDSREISYSLPICERILIGNVPNYYIPRKG